MPVRFISIKPKKPIILATGLQGKLESELNGFVSQVEDKMASYPPQQATKSGYVRTMTLGRSWSIVRARKVGGSLVASVGSNANIAPYAKWVEGEQQAKEMARRGWPRVMEVAPTLWNVAKGVIIKLLKGAGG
jgi:hypothetical protein